MRAGLAEALRRFGQRYLREHTLSPQQARVWRAILACRTPALGGALQQCDGCGRQQWRFHSCRNRHCPQCQNAARDSWRRQRLAELLPVPYCHLVFTLPHVLNGLAACHPRWVYRTLMECTAATLLEFAANPRWLGATPAITLVLHTWTQNLQRHLHVHALLSCGGLDSAGQWRAPTRAPGFLFPVHALSRVFRGKFLAALHAAGTQGALPRDPAADAATRQARRQRLLRHPWVVYAKTPPAGPAVLLDYLSRYTYRIAVSDERIVGIDTDGVRLRVRADEDGGKRTLRIDGASFIGRFLQHVLPDGFKRIRHYGLLSPAAKTRRLAQACVALAMPAADPVAREEAAAFLKRVSGIEIDRCPHCQVGHWRTVASLSPAGSAPLAAALRCRGPPR